MAERDGEGRGSQGALGPPGGSGRWWGHSTTPSTLNTPAGPESSGQEGVKAEASRSGGATAGSWQTGGLRLSSCIPGELSSLWSPPRAQQTTPPPHQCHQCHPSGTAAESPAADGEENVENGAVLLPLDTPAPRASSQAFYSTAEPCSTHRSRARPAQPRAPVPASPLNAASDFSRLLCVYLFPVRSGVSRL